MSGAYYKSWDAEGAKLTQSTAPGQSLSAQRSNGIVGSDASRWASGLANWSSPDTAQSRPNPPRSTSPPTSFQNTSNSSPSFNATRLTNGHSNTFPTTLAGTPSGLVSRGSISGPSGRVNSLQAGFGGFPRTNSGTSAFDDGTASRETVLPSSRHSESESTLQFNNDVSGFPQGIGSHARHASRPSLGGATASYYQQQPQPGSRSNSLNPQFDEAGLDAARRYVTGNLASNSPAPQFNTTASSQLFRWGGEFTPGNGVGQNPPYPQESRRESLAMSVNQSAMNSPRAFGSARLAEPWATPTAPVDFDPLARTQRSLSQISRLANQSPYIDPTFSQINQSHYLDSQAQLMQQMMQFPGYAMPGQQYYPPTAPAAYGGRPMRNEAPYENYKATPQLLAEFKKTNKGANRKWQLRVREYVFWSHCDPYLLACRTFLVTWSISRAINRARGSSRRKSLRQTATTSQRCSRRSSSMPNR